jgi:hypothetical protein
MYGTLVLTRSIAEFKARQKEKQTPPSFADFIVHSEKFLFEFLAELRLRDFGLWNAHMGVRVNGKETTELFAKVRSGDTIELFMKPAKR